MKSESGRIALACLFGSAIGTLLALSASLQYHLSMAVTIPLGCLIGGLIAYLCYDPKQAWQKAGQAWSKLQGWKPNKRLWKLQICLIIPAFSLGLSVGIFSTIFFWLIIMTDPRHQNDNASPVWLGITFFIGVSSLYYLASSPKYFYWENEQDILNNWRRRTWQFSLIGWPFILAYKIVTSIPTMITTTFSGCVWMCQFVKTVFILIHSNCRLICLVDTFFGVTVGFSEGYWHNSVFLGTFIGAIVGPVLGLINYQLVSIRWLKLHQKAQAV